MANRIAGVAPAVILMFSSASAVAGECLRAIITGDPDYRPISYLDGTRLRGAAFDIVEAALDRIAQPYEVRTTGPWKRVLAAGQTGEIDIIVEVKPTPERERYLAFTGTPVYSNPVAAFTRRADHRVIHGWNDLVGLHGARVLGNSFSAEFDDFVEHRLDITEVARVELGFKMVEAGHLDYFLDSYYAGFSYLLETGQTDAFTVQQPYMTDTPSFVGFARNGNCLGRLEALDAALDAMRRDGSIKRLFDAAVARRPTGHPPAQ